MHDDIEYAGVVKVLKQSYTVTTFHFEPTTEVSRKRHKPFLLQATTCSHIQSFT